MALNHSPKANRRSIRLREYDYAQSGMYFFTVCTHERELLFGDGVDGEMHSNDFAQIVWDEGYKSTTVRHELDLDTFVVMPNHIHGIILLKNRASVGASGRSPFSSGPSRNSLGAFIAGFKAATTKRINDLRATPRAAVWQRNYYDHIIRDENSLTRIREYIVTNPLQWDLDPENPQRVGDRPVAPTHKPETELHGDSLQNGR